MNARIEAAREESAAIKEGVDWIIASVKEGAEQAEAQAAAPAAATQQPAAQAEKPVDWTELVGVVSDKVIEFCNTDVAKAWANKGRLFQAGAPQNRIGRPLTTREYLQWAHWAWQIIKGLKSPKDIDTDQLIATAPSEAQHAIAYGIMMAKAGASVEAVTLPTTTVKYEPGPQGASSEDPPMGRPL